MELSIIIAFCAGILGGGAAYYGCTWTSRRMLYGLQCAVEDFEGRLTSKERRAAANKRWEQEDELDLKLQEFAKPAASKPKGWQKWGSSKNSNSARYSERPPKDSQAADSQEP